MILSLNSTCRCLGFHKVGFIIHTVIRYLQVEEIHAVNDILHVANICSTLDQFVYTVMFMLNWAYSVHLCTYFIAFVNR